MKIATSFVRRVVALVRTLEDETHEFSVPQGMQLTVLEASQMPAYHVLHPGEDPVAIRARLARGDLCFAVLDGSRIVHATWASSVIGPLAYLEAEVALEDGDVCFYDSYTHPAWRGRDLSRCRDEFCRRHYRAAGMRRALALIARENVAGLRTAEPLGYRPIGEYGLLRLGLLRHRWVTTHGSEAMPRLVAGLP